MEKIFYFLFLLFRRRTNYKIFRHGVKNMMKTCALKPLTRQQKREIIDYYKKTINKRPKLYWHQFYYSMNGEFSVKYIPNDLYFGQLQYVFYNSIINQAYDDKNLYDIFFPNAVQPKILLKCTNGHFYKDNKLISKEQALSFCDNISEAIIKPTFLSAGGSNVRFFSSVDGFDIRVNKPVKEVFAKYGKNFNIQEVIHQHEALAKLNPSSVNTIRVVTYFREQEVVLLYAVMRIGESGSEVDNTTDGGYTCGILADGKLKKEAYGFNPSKGYTISQSGITFEGYQLPCFDKVIETAKELHTHVPQIPIVGWDLTVNTKNEVVFIEMNAPCGLHQSAAGPAFGEYTDEILKKSAFQKRFFLLK